MPTIRIKRSSGSSAPTTTQIQNAELAFSEQSEVLYYGKGVSGNNAQLVIPIAGSGAFITKSTNQTDITGAKTFSNTVTFTGTVAAGAITATTAATSDNSTSVATTAFVRSALQNYTVNSISITADASATNIITTTVSASTTSPAITVSFKSQTSKRVLASPVSNDGTPVFRALDAADIPTLTSDYISDFNTKVRTNSLSQLALPTASVDLNSLRIIRLATPVDPTDAANKDYVDTKALGLKPKDAVKVATTANITLNGGATTAIDGVTLNVGDRILVKDQTSAAQNGVYIYSSGSWSRSTDIDAPTEFIGAYVFVENGNINANRSYTCSNTSEPTIGTTPITWTLFSKVDITVESPIVKSGAQLQLNTVPVNKGGTGATTLSGYVFGNGASAFTAVTTIPIASGGTGATTESTARANLGAAASGSNSDITQLSGLTTALSVSQGGTGSNTATGARSNLSAAKSGANSDITSLTGLTTPLSAAQGGTGQNNLASVTVGNATTAGSATSATTASNIGSGSSGQIPYQISAGSTSFITPGAAKTVLRSTGTSSAPAFQSLDTLTFGSGFISATYNGSSSITASIDSSSAGAANKIVAYDSSGNVTASTFLGAAILPAGTTTKPPLKLTNSTNQLSEITAGSVEYVNNVLYFTPSSTRRQIAYIDDTLIGTWNGTVISAAKGGTGVSNTNTITLGGNINTNGAFSTGGAITFSGTSSATINIVGSTTVNLPTSGTLATLAGVESLSNKTFTTTVIELKAGTASVAPLTFKTGTNLTTPVAGSMEFDGSNLYFTASTSRKQLAYINDTYTGTATWNGQLISPTYGGTGRNNGSYTITVGGNFSTAQQVTISGGYATTIAVTGTTNVTMPTSGTILSSDSVIDGGTF